MDNQLQKLHEGAWQLGAIYIAVVMSIYLLGVSLIVRRSGSELRDLLKFLCPCLTQAGPMESYNRRRHQRGDRPVGTTARLSPPKVKVTLEESQPKEDEDYSITLVSYA